MGWRKDAVKGVLLGELSFFCKAIDKPVVHTVIDDCIKAVHLA